MCTVVVSLAPQDRMPLLLLGVRDELTGRPWRPPARHWPSSPLIGGLDEQAGGTWLALNPDRRRLGCVLNGRGEFAPAQRRRSRGELPLRAAGDGPDVLRDLAADPGSLARFDPFHLVCADTSAVLLLSWDGRQAALTGLGPGTHMLTNAGHMYPPTGIDPRTGQKDAKAERFGPRFAAARPSGDPDAPIKDAWGDWLVLAAGDDLPGTDPAAIIARRELPDGRMWGSTSVSLVALARDGRLRYDFQPAPPDPAAWYEVGTGG
jgi:Transport and Golgi organisation 2